MSGNDLLIGSTSLKTFGAIADFNGIMSEGPLRGANLVYPGVAGEVHTPKVRGAYVFTVPLVLLGTSWADINDAVANLKTLLDTSTSAFTMHRTLERGSGLVTQTAQGDYLSGLQPELIGWDSGRIALDLVNLDGVWA